MVKFIYKGEKFTCKKDVLSEVIYLLFDMERCRETAKNPPVFNANYWEKQAKNIFNRALKLCKTF